MKEFGLSCARRRGFERSAGLLGRWRPRARLGEGDLVGCAERYLADASAIRPQQLITADFGQILKTVETILRRTALRTLKPEGAVS